jgi:Tfp pilus assembly protein PilN
MVIGVVLVGSLLALAFIIRGTTQANAAAATVQSQINSLSQQERTLQKQAQDVQNSLSVEQLQTLRSAHELVDRKRFSWSRLFADLESTLPGAVRVSRITVKDVATRGQEMIAELDLTIVAKKPTTVTDMIADMDRGGVFQAELRSQNLQKGRGETGTEYELSVHYRPRAGSAIPDMQATSLAAIESSASSKGDSR